MGLLTQDDQGYNISKKSNGSSRSELRSVSSIIKSQNLVNSQMGLVRLNLVQIVNKLINILTYLASDTADSQTPPLVWLCL